MSFFPEDWLSGSATSVVYRSERSWGDRPAARKFGHFMRRAWSRLGLEAILAIGGKPTVYFKRVHRFDGQTEAELQRLCWNQGTATMLVVRDNSSLVRIYSSMVTPSQTPIDVDGDSRLVETLTNVRDALKLDDFIRRTETGKIYTDHAASFSADAAVDKTLLRSLKAASLALCTGADALKPSIAHALLGRLLFTCYLRARGVLSEAYLTLEAGVSYQQSPDHSPLTLQQIISQGTLTDAKETLFKIFTAVKRDFNGSLFGKELEGEKNAVKAEHVSVLRRFLNGDPLDEGGQLSFGFPVYDFSLIPVETISAIYESFLKNEGEVDSGSSRIDQNQTGSFYTPRHLAELTTDLATDGWETLLDKKCLDPSCGSGIFLVILFNRMAEEWRARHPSAATSERAKALREILCRNFWGVDLNATACRITCFSLYLALFDQLEPPDIWDLKRELEPKGERVLPPLLAQPENGFAGETPRILADNFFSKALPLPHDFHLVIGNPPWIGRSHNPDAVMNAWVCDTNNVDLPRIPDYSNNDKASFEASGSNLREISRAQRESCILPERQSAHAFMWKIPKHMNKDGRACLVLPSKVWVNEKTNLFQSTWLRSFTLEHVIQLADYSFIIFEDADCPAVVARFRLGEPDIESSVIKYDVPKVDRDDPRHALITIGPDDQKAIRLRDVLNAADSKCATAAWKPLLWGTGRDLALLSRLRQMPTLGAIAGEPEENKRWVKGQGFKPFKRDSYLKNPKKYGEPIDRWWTDSQLFISPRCKQLSLVVLRSDAVQIGDKMQLLHRSPAPDVFRAPMVLVTQGFGKAAYCDFDVIFQHALQSISARDANDANLLKFLAGVITSPLAKYYLFHTAANWGSERDKVLLSELLHMPFPLPEECSNPERAQKIVDEVAKAVSDSGNHALAHPFNFQARADEIARARNTIDPLVFEYYGLSTIDRRLVFDTLNIFIPSSTPNSITKTIPTLQESTPDERENYAEQLCATINAWARKNGPRLSAHGFIASKLGLAVLEVTKDHAHKRYSEQEASDRVGRIMADIEEYLHVKGRKLAYTQGFALFEQSCAYVLKPLARRNWTNSAAFNDADSILSGFISK